MQSRTHTCGELRLSDAGKKVKLCGWLENFREVGAELGFVVIRDFYGTTQVVAENADMVKQFKAITKRQVFKPAVCNIRSDRFCSPRKRPRGQYCTVYL